MNNELKSTDKIKKELLLDFGITTDRDLVKQLNISKSDKKKLFKWLELQTSYSFNEGYCLGERSVKDKILETLNNI